MIPELVGVLTIVTSKLAEWFQVIPAATSAVFVQKRVVLGTGKILHRTLNSQDLRLKKTFVTHMGKKDFFFFMNLQ